MDQLVVGAGVPLSGVQWARIASLLPNRTPHWGGRVCDHREVINAIAFTLQAVGASAREVRHWQDVCHRLRMWAVDGTCEGVFTR
ncbi:transposase [Streptomyces sp. NPDC001781]